MAERVTIGVPIYRGKAFLKESLDSVLNQTYKDYLVIMSLDEPDAESEEICRTFLNDTRFRMVIQPQRLGWMDNMNWLMSQVETDFWHLQEQDDVIAPSFLEALMDCASRNPQAAVVYSDIRVFGTRDFPIIQNSVVGNAYVREMTLLHDHLSAVALVGVSRTEALRQAGGIPGNEMENVFAEVAWMAGMAGWGELHRVPGELFYKRFHGDNTVTKWFGWPRPQKLLAWEIHCLSMFHQAVRIDSTLRERRLLFLAAVDRLLSPTRTGTFIKNATPVECATMLDGFLGRAPAASQVSLPSLLEADWNEIEGWTRAICSAERPLVARDAAGEGGVLVR